MAKEWIKLVNKNGFQGIEEPWCNNQGVAILPFITIKNKRYFLQINEKNPLLDENKLGKYSTITGGLENLNPIKTVHMELEEEVGIILNNDTPIYNLGIHYSSKSSSKKWHYFAVDLTNLKLPLNKKYMGIQDGTEFEKETYGIFITEEQLQNSNDSFALAIYGKLIHCLLTNTLNSKKVFNAKQVNQEEDLYSYEYQDEISLMYKSLMF